MKTYKETKSEIKKLVIANGLDNITGYDIVALLNDGHNGTTFRTQSTFSSFLQPQQNTDKGGSTLPNL